MKDFNLENRKYVIGGVAVIIVLLYIIRLFALQIASDDYKKNADSNAFLKKIEYPSRGTIFDRNGKLLVYNQPSYDIMVVMDEEKGHLDTLDFCNSLGIAIEAIYINPCTLSIRRKKRKHFLCLFLLTHFFQSFQGACSIITRNRNKINQNRVVLQNLSPLCKTLNL